MRLREYQEKKSNEISKLNAVIQSLREENSTLKDENNSFSRQIKEQQNQIRLLKDAIDNLPKPENKPSQMIVKGNEGTNL
jgi:uncharacterized coiled-coil DUF342 family protein